MKVCLTGIGTSGCVLQYLRQHCRMEAPEKKGNTTLNFHFSFIGFEGSPLDKSTWKKRDREATAPVIDFILLRYRAGLRKVEGQPEDVWCKH